MDCVDLQPGRTAPRCVLCREDLGGANISANVEPFWNKLGQFNSYPLQRNARNFLVAFLALSFVAGLLIEFIPIWIVGLLIALGVFSTYISYSFKSLTKTAKGNFEAPTYDEAIGFNSDGMTWRVIGLFVALTFISVFILQLLGIFPLMLFLFLMTFAMPAILMVFAMSKHLSVALNPAVIAGTIGRIGIPYLILFGFFLLINFSTYFVEGLIDQYLPGALAFSLSFTANLFFNLILFHMLGYVAYQYHSELGYGVDADQLATNENVQISPELRNLAHADVYIQEGRYDDAEAELVRAGQDPRHAEKAYGKLIKLNMARKDKPGVIKAAKFYFANPLLERHKFDAWQTYQKVQEFEPRFKPMNANARAVLLQKIRSRSQAEHAHRLMDDLEEKFVGNPDLPKALLAKAKYYIDVESDDAQGLQVLEDLNQNYPQGDHTEEANQLLTACRNLAG